MICRNILLYLTISCYILLYLTIRTSEVRPDVCLEANAAHHLEGLAILLLAAASVSKAHWSEEEEGEHISIVPTYVHIISQLSIYVIHVQYIYIEMLMQSVRIDVFGHEQNQTRHWETDRSSLDLGAGGAFTAGSAHSNSL